MNTSTPKQRVPLYRAAHGRTGDKGDRSNISLIAWHPELFPAIADQVTEDAVARHFESRRPTRVTRFVLPNLHAMNVVIDGALDGGVNQSMNLDTHGKALSFLLLDMPIEIDSHLLPYLAPETE